MITLASLENQTNNLTAGNTQLMRTASNLSLNIEDLNLVPIVPESLDSGNGMAWFLVGFLHVTSEKQPSRALNQSLLVTLFIRISAQPRISAHPTPPPLPSHPPNIE